MIFILFTNLWQSGSIRIYLKKRKKTKGKQVSADTGSFRSCVVRPHGSFRLSFL